MRLDKYLKVSRLIKRRTVANEVADAGRILINGKVAKASQAVNAGDIIEVTFGNRPIKVKVLSDVEPRTKDVARDMVFAANQAGCGFLGRPLVEATGSLRNFRTQAQIGGTDEVTAFHAAVAELLSRLNGWEKPAPIRHVLALHASQRATSNTLALWELVKAGLPSDLGVQEICLRNGTMADCNGCSYTACLHFGEQGGCFYGGPMVDEVYPAVRKCDALVMLCANYNDALAANLTACVNRLTALFRQTRMYDKRIFGLIVSGYSGGGKKMIAEYRAPERSPLLNAPRQYALGQTHKHLKEMKAVTGLASEPVFCPVVADFYSGMQVTVPLFAGWLKPGAGMEEVKNAYKALYTGPVVSYTDAADEGGFLSAAAQSGLDSMKITVAGNEQRMLLLAVYDNLGKGASGAAVECMNLVTGAEKTLGLEL